MFVGTNKPFDIILFFCQRESGFEKFLFCCTSEIHLAISCCLIFAFAVFTWQNSWRSFKDLCFVAMFSNFFSLDFMVLLPVLSFSRLLWLLFCYTSPILLSVFLWCFWDYFQSWRRIFWNIWCDGGASTVLLSLRCRMRSENKDSVPSVPLYAAAL